MHRPYNPHHQPGITFIRVFFMAAVITLTVIAMFVSLNIPDRSKALPSSSPIPSNQFQTSSAPSPSETPATNVQVSVSGPGGCNSVQSCLDYCNSHPEECAPKK